MTKLWILGVGLVVVATCMVGCTGEEKTAVNKTPDVALKPQDGKTSGKDNAIFQPNDPPPPADAKGKDVQFGGKSGGG